jgi:hypothetical protein
MLTNMLRIKNANVNNTAIIVNTFIRPYASQAVKMPECDFKPEKYKVNIKKKHINYTYL